MSTQPTFRLGITMAGAVSAGAYTAGVISGRPAPFIRKLGSIIGPIPIPVVLMVALSVLIWILLKVFMDPLVWI